MKTRGLDGYLVPLADEFQGEFLPACAERLSFLTGFTGSGGGAVVLADKACAYTDGRYLIQIAAQVDTAIYTIVDFTKTPVGEWLAGAAPSGAVIGFDPMLYTPEQVGRLEEKAPELVFKPVAGNLVDAIWEDRPAPPEGKAEVFPDAIAGRSVAEKIVLVAESLDEAVADAALITMPDSVCWLLNVRGADVEQTPLVRSYALAYADGHVEWFAPPEKVTDAVRAHIGNRVSVRPIEDVQDALAALKGKTVLVDERHTALHFKTLLEEAGANIINQRDPCIWPKACKTPAEIESIRQAHIRDGAALAKFLRWLDKEAPGGTLSELDVAAKIEECRRADPAYRGASFGTIAGFGANGAIIHYRADEKSNARITPPGLLLVDSGGQYGADGVWGTTDITRTIAVGAPTQAMKENFTRVLKGHIALARVKFAKGTNGMELDVLARGPLQDAGLDYAHGTGHGVGCYLGVHEEAANISPRGKEALEPGMLISNEPGYYEEGAYGIRCENLVLVMQSGLALAFETVSLAPFDLSLVVPDMLTDEEREWLNTYHARVYETISPLVDKVTAAWLKEKTAAV